MVKAIKYLLKKIRPRLEIGEVFCDRCNGVGIVNNKEGPGTYYCRKCLGTGKLDWVENVTGKVYNGKPRRIKQRYKIISKSERG